MDPDIVILRVTPNDFLEIQSSFSNQNSKPQFVFDGEGSNKLANVPVRSVGPEAEKGFGNSIPVSFKEWLGWNSYAENVLDQKYFGWGQKMEGKACGESDKSVFSTSSIQLFAAIVSRLQEEIDKRQFNDLDTRAEFPKFKPCLIDVAAFRQDVFLTASRVGSPYRAASLTR